MTSFKYNYQNPSVRRFLLQIGHFRVPKTLTFKMRPNAQPFLWKWVLFEKNDFHINGWAPTLVLKKRPGGTRKWPIRTILFFKSQREWQFFKNEKANTKWIAVVVVKFHFKVWKVCHTAISHSLRASSLGRSTTTKRKCLLISRFVEDVNKRRRQFLSLSKLECCPQETNSRGICLW